MDLRTKANTITIEALLKARESLALKDICDLMHKAAPSPRSVKVHQFLTVPHGQTNRRRSVIL